MIFKIFILIYLVFIFLPFLSADSYFEGIAQGLKEAQETLEETVNIFGHGIKTVFETIAFVDSLIDSTVEEECTFQCPEDEKPRINLKHVPKSNGCGSLGMFLNRDELSRPEMEDCCNKHDFCYDSCGSDKEECDKTFKKCLYSTCNDDDYFGDIISEKKCKGGAKLLYTATMALGCKSYKDAQRNACICIPKYPEDKSQRWKFDDDL